MIIIRKILLYIITNLFTAFEIEKLMIDNSKLISKLNIQIALYFLKLLTVDAEAEISGVLALKKKEYYNKNDKKFVFKIIKNISFTSYQITQTILFLLL